MYFMYRGRFVVLGLGCCLLLAACGGSRGVSLSGDLVLPADASLVDNDLIKLGFVPEDPSGVVCWASCSPSGQFTVRGPTGDRVPVGKYKLTVQLQAYPGGKDSKKRNEAFAKVNDEFSNAKSKLAYEVTADSPQSIVVDLTKGTVSKK